MGLDMYAYAIDSTEDFDDVIIESKPQKAFYSQAQLLHEWRKHPNLHGWIEQNIYRNADNQDQDFNCVLVKIDRENLIALENAIKNNALPFTTGFFFGESSGDDDEKEDDLEFIEKAKAAMSQGMAVYYDSWW